MDSEQLPSNGQDPREVLLAVKLQAPRGHVWFPVRQFDARSLLIEAMLKLGVEQGTVTEVVRGLDLHEGQSVVPDAQRQTYDGYSFEQRNGQGPPVGVHISRFREEVGAALCAGGFPVLDPDRIGRRYFRGGDTPGVREEHDVPQELRPFLLNGVPKVTLEELGWRRSA